MKTSRYILLSFAAVAIAASCKEELNPDKPINANPGDEVVFGAALPGKTKTVYGEETSSGFPIYWVNGDKVRVASPQCLSGRNVAEYQIAVAREDQNYATNMTRTGEYGVQWGDAKEADFYSIYPSSASTKLEVSGEGVTTTLHVDATQFANTTEGSNSYYSQPAEMGNVVMYAKATASKTDQAVELHYTPFSTVLEFKLIAQSEGGKEEPLIIQSITLTAPTGTTIAGDFAFNFPSGKGSTPSIEAMTGGSNAITMHFLKDNQYNISLTPTKNTMKAKMCLMPISNVSSLAGWKVEVNTSAGTFIKTLKDTDFENEDGSTKNTALAPGKVHKITLPKLGFVSDEWVYDPSRWIPSLPDYENIYLSEISLPGAWYAGSTEGVSNGTGYQATSSIRDLWEAGVRAFAVETKTVTGGRYDATPSGVVLSGSGSNSASYLTYDSGTNSLNPTAGSKGRVYYNGTNISTIIQSVAQQVKSDEFGVLVLSYADGGESGRRYVDYGAWLQLLYDAYNGLSATVKEKIYQEQVTANTTVKDVRGKLILKINVDANIAMSGSVSRTNFAYDNNLPALFSYNPFLLQISTNAANFAHPYYSDLYWSGWADTYRTCAQVSTLTGISDAEAAKKFIWVFSSANRTHTDNPTTTIDIPTYAQRQAALGAMMNFSKTVYDRSNHNVWFYFNCGGTQATSSTSSSTSPTNFASTMNSWLLKTINDKTDPSPLGIVMFNQCTGPNATYHGEDIIKAIIEMNSKFYLKHAGTSGGSTGGSTSGNGAQNDAMLTNGGEAI